jgi:hypothetical protein
VRFERTALKQSVVVHAYNPSTQEAETEGSGVWGQEFEANLGYIVRLCLKKKNNNNKNLLLKNSLKKGDNYS